MLNPKHFRQTSEKKKTCSGEAGLGVNLKGNVFINLNK